MSYKSRLINTRHTRSELSNGVRKAEPERMTKQGFHSRVPEHVADRRATRNPEFQLASGRTVRLEECHISVSMIGFLAGSTEAIRAEVICQLRERVRAQFPGRHGLFVKPLPAGELPTYVFMVALVCDQPVSDSSADSSNLVICWLSNDIETSLPELIGREIRSIDWNEHALDSNL